MTWVHLLSEAMGPLSTFYASDFIARNMLVRSLDDSKLLPFVFGVSFSRTRSMLN